MTDTPVFNFRTRDNESPVSRRTWTWKSKRKSGRIRWTCTWTRTKKNWVTNQYESFQWIGIRWIVNAHESFIICARIATFRRQMTLDSSFEIMEFVTEKRNMSSARIYRSSCRKSNHYARKIQKSDLKILRTRDANAKDFFSIRRPKWNDLTVTWTFCRRRRSDIQKTRTLSSPPHRFHIMKYSIKEVSGNALCQHPAW